MATQLFFTIEADSEYATAHNDAKLNAATAAWRNLAIGTSRGSGSQNLSGGTVAGPTDGVEVVSSGLVVVWYTAPLAADVTISGSITWNLWAAEADMAANVAINGQLEVIDGATGTITLIDKTARTVEAAVGALAVNNFAETPAAGVACKKGDRLRIRVFGDDSTANMSAALAFTFACGAASASVQGDSYVTLTENLTFDTATPTGTTVYLNDTVSDMAAGVAAPALLSSFTGSNEDPLSEGGNWANLQTNGLERVSNQARGGANRGSYWTPAEFGPSFEASVTIAGIVTGTTIHGIVVRASDPGATWDGYQLRVNTTGSNIVRYDNGTAANLVANASVTWAAGDKLGVACVGSTIYMYRYPSGGSAWAFVAQATDATYPTTGKLGMVAGNASNLFDDFYAGDLFSHGFPGAPREAWTSSPNSVQTDVTNTSSGWVAQPGTQVTDTAAGAPVEWFTKPLQAITLGGRVSIPISAIASNINSDSSMRIQIARVDADGSNPAVWAYGGNGSETPAVSSTFTHIISGDDLAISDGQRLRIRLYVKDTATGPMVTGHTVTTSYNSSSTTRLTFSQTLTEFSAGTSASAGAASGTGSASNASTSVAPNATVASGTGSAFNATVSTASVEEAPANPALGTGTALNASTSVKPTAGAATGTGAANNAGKTVAPNAGHASGTGAALNASKSVKPNAAAATGTGAAQNAGKTVSVNTGTATGTGSAFDATISTEAGGGPVWTTPGDGTEIGSTPILAFIIPVAASPLFFDLQIDSADTFDTVDFQEFRSDQDQTGWDFWNGTGWEAVAPTGVPETYAGNEARYTVQTPLDAGTHYRRVRAGTTS